MRASENSLITEIVQCILQDDNDVDSNLFAERVAFLYSPILEEGIASPESIDIDALKDEITRFEKSQLYTSTTYLEQFGKHSLESVLVVFSSVSFGLAVERLKGNRYADLASLLGECFQALIADKARVSESVRIANATLISETILDFSFSSKETGIMSLRLKRQWDSMK